MIGFLDIPCRLMSHRRERDLFISAADIKSSLRGAVQRGDEDGVVDLLTRNASPYLALTRLARDVAPVMEVWESRDAWAQCALALCRADRSSRNQTLVDQLQRVISSARRIRSIPARIADAFDQVLLGNYARAESTLVSIGRDVDMAEADWSAANPVPVDDGRGIDAPPE